MTKLIPKINKTDFINKSRLHAVEIYEYCYEGTMQSLAFMEGVKYAIEQLKQPKP